MLNTIRNMITFDAYATKICRHAELPAKDYESHSLNTVVLTLPFGAAHAALAEQPLDALPCLGETVSLNQHMQVNFFDVVADPDRELWEFTAPVLVTRGHLEQMDAWDDWCTLTGFLARFHLEPVIVFQNKPLPFPDGEERYVADVRVLFVREGVFGWRTNTN